MASLIRIEREVEGLAGLKVWLGIRQLTYTSEIPKLMVERLS